MKILSRDDDTGSMISSAPFGSILLSCATMTEERIFRAHQIILIWHLTPEEDYWQFSISFLFRKSITRSINKAMSFLDRDGLYLQKRTSATSSWRDSFVATTKLAVFLLPHPDDEASASITLSSSLTLRVHQNQKLSNLLYLIRYECWSLVSIEYIMKERRSFDPLFTTKYEWIWFRWDSDFWHPEGNQYRYYSYW